MVGTYPSALFSGPTQSIHSRAPCSLIADVRYVKGLPLQMTRFVVEAPGSWWEAAERQVS